MARDVQLVLASGETVTATGALDYIEVEGGMACVFRLFLGTLATGSSPTMDLKIQASLDAGSNYYKFAEFQQIVNTDDDKEIACMGYIPRPATASNKVRLRAYAVLGGSGGSFEIDNLFAEPIDFAPEASDERRAKGLCALLSSV